MCLREPRTRKRPGRGHSHRIPGDRCATGRASTGKVWFAQAEAVDRQACSLQRGPRCRLDSPTCRRVSEIGAWNVPGRGLLPVCWLLVAWLWAVGGQRSPQEAHASGLASFLAQTHGGPTGQPAQTVLSPGARGPTLETQQ